MAAALQKENGTMNLKHLTRTAIIGGALYLAGALPSATLFANTAPIAVQDSVEVSRLLREARTVAGKLASTTDHFNSYTRSRLDWRTHADKVHQVKNEVNALGAHLADLEALHHEAAPWQQGVIQNMRPILAELAKNTEFVIQHISEKPRLLSHPEYRNALENKYELATQLAQLTDDSVRYGETKNRLEDLRTRLEMN
jgi:hypothetical protein